MRRILTVLLVVAVALMLALPAAAQDDEPLSPEAVVTKLRAAFLTAFTGTTEESMEEAFEQLVVTPEDEGAGEGVGTFILFYAMLLAPPPGEPAEIDGDTAIVKLQPETIEFVLVQQDGQWKVDMAATYERMPEKFREVFQPVVERSREKARQVACLSNLKQLATGALMYAQDHDETFPDADEWMDQIMPYIKNEAILKCPAASDLEYGYAMNAALSGMAMEDVTSLASTVMFFDSDIGTRNAAGGPDAACDPPRHNGGNNFAYTDGHAKWGREVPSFALKADLEKARQSNCLSNLKQLATGALMCAQDYDEVFPDADKWMDQIMPYIRNEAILKCPGAPDLEYGYAMNAALSGMAMEDVTSLASTVMFFDSDIGTRNAAGGPDAVCDPPRHNGGNNYAYTDGHAKWGREVPSFDPEADGEEHGQADAVVELSDDSFEAEVLKVEGWVLVDFGADRCDACRELKPVFHEMAREYEGRVKFASVDLVKSSKAQDDYGIRYIPTVILFRDGKQVDRTVGFGGEDEFRAWLEGNLQD